MARKIHRLALLLLLVLLPAPLCVEAIHLRPEEFIPHINDVTWHSAQTHCRKIHHDLITISDQAENQDIFALGGWIGLYLEGSQWKWSRRGERANYTIWKSGGIHQQVKRASYAPESDVDFSDSVVHLQAGKNVSQALVMSVRISSPMKKNGVQILVLKGICFYETLVIVRQEKTWVEALQHCRSLEAIDPSLPATVNKNHRYDLMSLLTSDHHVYAREKAKHATTDECETAVNTSRPVTDYQNHCYDLVSLLTPDDHDYAREKIQMASSDKVWTGLHFLAGWWMWVGGEVMQYTTLPQCPAADLCGSLGKNGTQSYWTRNCLRRRNFLCFKKE